MSHMYVIHQLIAYNQNPNRLTNDNINVNLFTAVVIFKYSYRMLIKLFKFALERGILRGYETLFYLL